MRMDDNTTLVAITFCVTALLISLVIMSSCDTKTKDPIAQRIEAVENATGFMSDASKERVMIEVLRGNTNSPEVILEKK